MTLPLIWLSGAILFLSIFAVRYIREIIKLKHYPSKDGITIVPSCEVPISIGVFRKRILLPRQDYTQQELHYILLHEHAHFDRHDHLIKMLVQIVCCIFWWNPLAYLLRREISQMLELRCDKAVTQNLTPEEKEEYLSVLLKLVKDSRRGGHSMLERFRQIAGRRARRGRATVLAMAFVAVCAGPALLRSPEPDNRITVTTSTGSYEVILRGDVDALEMDGSTWAWAEAEDLRKGWILKMDSPHGPIEVEVCALSRKE